MSATTAASAILADSATPSFRATLARLASDARDAAARATVVETAPMAHGVMPPLHVRDVDEMYQVLEGEVVFYVGDEIVRARRGDVVVARKGTVRTFHVAADRTRWLVLTALRSLTRYEDFTRALARPLEPGASWPSPEEAASLAAIAAANDIEILGPPGMLPAGLE